MKKLIIGFLLVWFVAVEGNSQWINLFAGRVSDISFPTTSVGYMTFGNRIKKTTDGGHTWTILGQNFGNFYVTGLQFLDEQTGFAAQGENLKIFKTTDGGANWVQVTTDPETLTASYTYPFQFTDEMNGYRYANSRFQKTTDGGSTWSTMIIMPVTNAQGIVQGHLGSMHFLSTAKGFALFGSGNPSVYTLMKTTDGGTTWISRAVPLVTAGYAVNFLDASTGFIGGAVSGAGVILKTTNGGLDWSPFAVDRPIHKIRFFGTNTAVAVGAIASQGVIVSTTDGGDSWVDVGASLGYLFFSGDDVAIAMPGSQKIKIAWQGQNNIQVGLNIYNSDDAGNTWERMAEPPVIRDGITSVSFVNESLGYLACGRDPGHNIQVHKSLDGGFNWSPVAEIPANFSNARIFFTTPSMGYSIHSDGRIFGTDDGGLNWTVQSTSNNQTLNDAYFVNSTGYAVGANGVIMKTINNGTNWDAATSGVTVSLNAVCALSENTAIAVGANGTIIKTTDGVNWSPRPAGTTLTLNGVHFPSATVGYAVGNSGKVLKTTNGGETWSSLISGTGGNISALCFPTEENGYFTVETMTAAGMYSTTNGGQSWVQQTYQDRPATDIQFVSPTRGISVGYNVNISMCSNPSFIGGPQSQTLNSGETLVLSSTVNGTGTIAYQWKMDGVNIGANSPTLTIPNVTGTNSGNYTVTVTDGCGTATSVTAMISVLEEAPASQPTQLVMTSATNTSVSFSFTPPATVPDGYIVLRKAAPGLLDSPANGTTYAAGANIGTSIVVQSGTATTFSDSGLTERTTYNYAVFAYNGNGLSRSYLLPSPLTGSSLSPEPTNHVTNVSFSNLGSSSLTVSFSTALGSPTGYLVLRKKGSPPTALPTDAGSYVAGVTISDAIVAGVGPNLVLNETGLDPGAQYYYIIFPYMGAGISTNYLTAQSSDNLGVVTTLPEAPVAIPPVNVLYDSFTARWNPVVGGDKYNLDVSEDPDFSTFLPGFQARQTNFLIETVNGLKINTNYYYRVRSVNNTGESANSNTITLRTQDVPSGTTPLQISAPTYSVSFPSDEQTQKVTVSLLAGLGPRVVTLFYRGISDTEFDDQSAVATAANANVFEGLISRTMLDDLGVEFYFSATDAAYTVTTDRHTITKSYSGTTSPAIPITTFGGTLESYQVISIPLALEDNLIQTIFESILGPYDDTKWRIVRNQNGGNVDYPTINKIELGKSYWFNAREPITIKTGLGATPAVDQSTPFTLALGVGWNQIATPFPFAIDWDDVLEENGNPAGVGSYKVYVQSNISFTPSNSMQPFSGGFVFTDAAINLTVPVTLKGTAGGRIRHSLPATDIAQDEWFVPFTLSQGSALNVDGGIGMAAHARTSKDAFDDITLPRFIKYLEFNSYHTEFFAPRFSKDVVPPSDKNTWDVAIESNFEDTQMVLRWPSKDLGDNGAQLLLYDTEAGLIIDMKSASEYSFENRSRRNFKIIYNRVPDAALEMVSYLGIPYPNPSETIVQFKVWSQQEPFTLQIFDVLGRPVHRQSVNASEGLTEIKWDGGDRTGTRVSPGLYIYKIQEGSTGFRKEGRLIIK